MPKSTDIRTHPRGSLAASATSAERRAGTPLGLTSSEPPGAIPSARAVTSGSRRTVTGADPSVEADCPVDLYLTVGVGAANAGELVVGGRGIAVVCLEHFTGRANPQTFGMGLAPHLLPLWIAHEVAHAVRYTSPTSRAVSVCCPGLNAQ